MAKRRGRRQKPRKNIDHDWVTQAEKRNQHHQLQHLHHHTSSSDYHDMHGLDHHDMNQDENNNDSFDQTDEDRTGASHHHYHHHHHHGNQHQHHHHHKHKKPIQPKPSSYRLLRWAVRSFFVCSAAYMFYHPIPDGIQEPYKYQVFLGGVKIFKHMTQACHMVGFDHNMCIRRLVSNLELFTPPADWDVRVADEYFDGVLVRVYQPIKHERKSDGALIFFHGGGFMVGSPKSYDAMSSTICRDLDIVVVSVDYRLAPDYPSPIPLQDCENATRYFFEHAHRWGVDPAKIGIAGDSAGGNLAAAVILKFRDTGSRHNFLFQALLYPLLQAMDLTLPSYQLNHWHAIPYILNDHVATVVLNYINKDLEFVPHLLAHNHTSAKTKSWYKQYIHWSYIPEDLIPEHFQPQPDHHGDDHVIKNLESDLLNPYNFPLMATSLQGLPPTFIMVAEYDTLRDDGLLFARRLEMEGIPVILDFFHNGWHGMLSFSGGPYIATMNTGKLALANFTNFMQPHFYKESSQSLQLDM